MKRLMTAVVLAAACWTANADIRPGAKPPPKPMGTAMVRYPRNLPVPKHTFAAPNEVWLVTNLIDDGTRTTISYRTATIGPDGRVVATDRTGVFCVGSARAVQNNDYRISVLEDGQDELSAKVRSKADRPQPRTDEEARRRNAEERDRLLKMQEQLRKAREAREASSEKRPPTR